jgi:hypothetical protein
MHTSHEGPCSAAAQRACVWCWEAGSLSDVCLAKAVMCIICCRRKLSPSCALLLLSRVFPNCTAKAKGERQVYVGQQLLEARELGGMVVRRPIDRVSAGRDPWAMSHGQ